MPVIRIHISHEELAAIRRHAEAMGVSVAEFAYGTLGCSMSHCREPSCAIRIAASVRQRQGDLPLWSDSARSVAIYESKPDVEQGAGPQAPS